MLDNDFFLVAAKDAFMEAARQFLFENYCRLHQVGLALLLMNAGTHQGAAYCCVGPAVGHVFCSGSRMVVAGRQVATVVLLPATARRLA